jgi:hypothetical protein
MSVHIPSAITKRRTRHARFCFTRYAAYALLRAASSTEFSDLSRLYSSLICILSIQYVFIPNASELDIWCLRTLASSKVVS